MRIYIHGIKSVRDGQFVALGNKITFLVGPNSAGKSTLLSALTNLNLLANGKTLEDHLIYSNPNKNNERAGVYSLGIEYKSKKKNTCTFIARNLFADLMIDFNDEISQKHILRSHIPITIDDSNNSDQEKQLEYYVNEKLLLRLHKKQSLFSFLLLTSHKKSLRNELENDGITLSIKNIENEKTLKTKILVDTISQILKEFQLEIDNLKNSQSSNLELDSAQNWITKIDSHLRNNTLIWDSSFARVLALDILSGKNLQKTNNLIEKAQSLIKKHITYIKEKYFGSLQTKISIATISAERTLPTESDCIFIFDALTETNNIYHRLILSAHNKNDYFVNDIQPNKNSLLKNVNRALSDSLFHDNGYQIRINEKVLIDKNDFEYENTLVDNCINDSSKFEGSMSLWDNHGRSLTFQDVGSGIGYVLPILIEAYSEKHNGMTFLQQPELHLHPAMQASLTDVLIDASSNHRIIAETHSEHMILRALKRVRQTTSGTLSDPSLSLTPDDVAINYFEPQLDGSTKIHNIRITADGDFLDRWPNGFFPEREQELFDE